MRSGWRCGSPSRLPTDSIERGRQSSGAVASDRETGFAATFTANSANWRSPQETGAAHAKNSGRARFSSEAATVLPQREARLTPQTIALSNTELPWAS
jgi:hypothetical protein